MQRRSFLGALIAAPLAALGLKAKPKAPTTPDIDVYHHGTRDMVVLPPGYEMSYISYVESEGKIEPGMLVEVTNSGKVRPMPLGVDIKMSDRMPGEPLPRRTIGWALSRVEDGKVKVKLR